jgi:hypothetical protein
VLLIEVDCMSWFIQRLLQVPYVKAFTLVYCEELAKASSELSIVKSSFLVRFRVRFGRSVFLEV